MKTLLTLAFLLGCSFLSQAQILFLDDFGVADRRIKMNLNTLEDTIWKEQAGEVCHAINLEGVGGVAYPVQFDNGPLEELPGVRVYCLADSLVDFAIEPGAIYTNAVVFRINDYESFHRFTKGFRRPFGDGFEKGGWLSISSTFSRDPESPVETLKLQYSESNGTQRGSLADIYIRPYIGEWLTLETSINTQSDSQIVLNSTLSGPSGATLASVNVILTNDREKNLVRGQSFSLHNHPVVYLSTTERVMEMKEIRVTKR